MGAALLLALLLMAVGCRAMFVPSGRPAEDEYEIKATAAPKGMSAVEVLSSISLPMKEWPAIDVSQKAAFIEGLKTKLDDVDRYISSSEFPADKKIRAGVYRDWLSILLSGVSPVNTSSCPDALRHSGDWHENNDRSCPAKKLGGFCNVAHTAATVSGAHVAVAELKAIGQALVPKLSDKVSSTVSGAVSSPQQKFIVALTLAGDDPVKLIEAIKAGMADLPPPS